MIFLSEKARVFQLYRLYSENFTGTTKCFSTVLWEYKLRMFSLDIIFWGDLKSTLPGSAPNFSKIVGGFEIKLW